MTEEKIYDDVATEEAVTEEVVEETVVEETVAEETVVEEVVEEQPVYQEPVKAKKGFAKASLVLGILAFITTLFFINYIFGILSLLFGILYLAKKADIKPKGKAITGIVLASLSLIVSTVLWVSVYNYVAKTDIAVIIEDVGALMGTEIDGRQEINNMVESATGGAMSLDTIEQFVGGEVTVERMVKFVGDVKEEEINAFVNKLSALDETSVQNIVNDFGGEVTYEKLEEKLGKDFTLKELMGYVEKFITPAPAPVPQQ